MDYKIYELKLKPLSPWISELTADTIFGHLCWQIKYESGDSALEEFLKQMEERPIFTISDVLPFDRLPRPLSEWDGEIRDADEDDFETNKHYNKIKYIPNNSFKKFIGTDLKSNEEIWNKKEEIEKIEMPKEFIEKVSLNKNIINRLSSSTGDNGIYSTEINRSNNKYNIFRLFIKFNPNKDIENININGINIDILKLLKNVFEIQGYGKKKSTGNGVFKIESIDKDFGINFYKGIDVGGLNNYVLLSGFIPSKNDSTNGHYKIYSKFPKMGESYSLEGTNFYKKPLNIIEIGSTFEKNNNYNGYVGKMIKNIDFIKKGIYHYGYGFTLEF